MGAANTSEICHDLGAVLEFMRQRGNAVDRAENQVAIGLRRDGQVIAGAVFERLNRHNVWVHVALRDAHANCRAFIRHCLVYAFGVCKVRRMSALVAASNAASRRAAVKLGFRQEAVLSGAAEDGGDMLVMALWRQECRYV